MKLVLCLIILSLVAACDPYKFGFKRNPAYVLYTAFKAAEDKDVTKFLGVTGKEALCLYGNDQGVSFLQQTLTIDEKNIEFKNSRLDAKYHKLPAYVGYWSYYNERYKIEVINKLSKEKIVSVVVDCDYGSEDKDPKFVNLNPKKFKKRECRLVKIAPPQGLPMTERCDSLKVVL